MAWRELLGVELGRLLYRLLLYGFLAIAGLSLATAAGAAAWDGDRREWDVQTLALLVGGIGFFVARVAGRPRPVAVEIGFVSSVGATLYASLTQPGNEPLFEFVIGAFVAAGFAWLVRRLEWVFADVLSFAASPEPAAAPVASAPSATPDLPVPSGKRTRTALLAAAIGGASGVLAARFFDRAR